jgi:hypothetical protein
MNTPVEKAKFTPKTGTNQKPFSVHFNPVSLQYSVSNTLKEEGSGKTKKQYTTQGTGKLTMDLIFDNTADGQDVRKATVQIAKLMEADPESSGSQKQVPSVVLFEWGAYKFQGMLESYKETLDFFSPKGVPLRASVNITMVEQDKIFTPGSVATGKTLSPNAVNVPAGQFSPASAAAAGGNPDAARGIGALNGAASLRFSSGASLAVSSSITLGPPAAFATGGAGIGVGFGAGAGITIGAGAAASFGANASVGMSTGGGITTSAGASGGALFGASASSGVSASAGAFAGLRVSSSSPTIRLDTGRFMEVSESVPLSVNSGDFSVGGQVIAGSSGGLRADVGADVDLRARIQFEVE